MLAKPAPYFTLTLFDGGKQNSKDLLGKAVLVNFWASWCVPCRAGARALEAAWQKYKDRDVVFLGVNIQDKEEDARAFIKEFGITYLNGRDENGKIAMDYGAPDPEQVEWKRLAASVEDRVGEQRRRAFGCHRLDHAQHE